MGKPEKIRPHVEAAFDSAAKCYEGKTEHADVIAAKTAVLSFIDESQCTEREGISVEANGSRGQGWVSISVSCGKLQLLV